MANDGKRWRMGRATVANSDKQWRTVWSSVVVSDRWTTMTEDGGGQWQWMVVNVNGERINWYKVRKIVMRKYKIEREKIEMK